MDDGYLQILQKTGPSWILRIAHVPEQFHPHGNTWPLPERCTSSYPASNPAQSGR